MPRSRSGPERRANARNEDAEVWTEEDRKRMTSLGTYIDKWNKRHGTPRQPTRVVHPLDRLLGITTEEEEQNA